MRSHETRLQRGEEIDIATDASEANLATTLEKLITRVGLVPCPQRLQTLRASRETAQGIEINPRHRRAGGVITPAVSPSASPIPDLRADRPSTRIGSTAQMHYLQVTQDHYRAGSEFTTDSGGLVGGLIGAISQAFGADSAQKNPAFEAQKGSKTLGNSIPVTRTGLEQLPETLGNEAGGDSVPPMVPPSLPITGELVELLELWESMTEAERVDLLAVARGLAASRA